MANDCIEQRCVSGKTAVLSRRKSDSESHHIYRIGDIRGSVADVAPVGQDDIEVVNIDEAISIGVGGARG